MRYYIYLIKDNETKERDFFVTKCRKEQAIYNLKNVKSDTKTKAIILKNNYTLKLLTEHDDINKEVVKNKLIEWKEHYDEIDEINKKNFINNSIYALHNNTRTQSLKYGLKNEILILNDLNTNNTFNMKLTKSLYTKSKFDYIGDYYLFEVKSLTYSIDKYNTAIMNIDKVKDTDYNHFVFIFEYTELDNTKKLFYHIYDHNYNYNKRFITPKDRINKCEIIDIQKDKLRQLEYTESISLPRIDDITDMIKFKAIIKSDKMMSQFN